MRLRTWILVCLALTLLACTKTPTPTPDPRIDTLLTQVEVLRLPSTPDPRIDTLLAQVEVLRLAPTPDPRIDTLFTQGEELDKKMDSLRARLDELVETYAGGKEVPVTVHEASQLLRECLTERIFAPGLGAAVPEDTFDIDELIGSMAEEGFTDLEGLTFTGIMFGCWGGP